VFIDESYAELDDSKQLHLYWAFAPFRLKIENSIQPTYGQSRDRALTGIYNL
jgi:hypothetical protein